VVLFLRDVVIFYLMQQWFLHLRYKRRTCVQHTHCRLPAHLRSRQASSSYFFIEKHTRALTVDVW